MALVLGALPPRHLAAAHTPSGMVSWVSSMVETPGVMKNLAQRTPATLGLHLSASSSNSPTLMLDLITSVPRAAL